MTPEDIVRQHAEIDALNAKYAGRLRIIKGIEANVTLDGAIDVPDATLATIEHVQIGLHDQRDTNATERLLRAMDNPHVVVVVHPHTSDGVDYDAVAEKAAKRGIALEVNGRDMLRRDRQSEATAMVNAALRHGARLQIGSDAHRKQNFVDSRYAVRTAARLGVKAEHLYHAQPFE
jgi:DNA polymerase (family 10)